MFSLAVTGGIMVIIAWHKPAFNYHNAAPMVLFYFGGMVSKSFDGDKYAVYETSLNLQK